MKAVVFDISSDLALFRKFYTNSSMLTYPFPPPTVILGLIGAILGITKDLYLTELQDAQVAVSIVQPVKKLRFSLNYVNTKDGDFALGKGRRQIPTEIIKETIYRIYVRKLKQEHEEDLVNLLRSQLSLFTPYLGISEFIANLIFVGYYECTDEEGIATVTTVVPVGKARIKLEEGLKLGRERVPFKMNPDRSVKQYTDVIFDADANPIAIEGTFTRVGEDNVIFF
jgi:CRISPR-associated protein Cas5h